MHVMAHGQDGATSASIWARKNPVNRICFWITNSKDESCWVVIDNFCTLICWQYDRSQPIMSQPLTVSGWGSTVRFWPSLPILFAFHSTAERGGLTWWSQPQVWGPPSLATDSPEAVVYTGLPQVLWPAPPSPTEVVCCRDNKTWKINRPQSPIWHERKTGLPCP